MFEYWRWLSEEKEQAKRKEAEEDLMVEYAEKASKAVKAPLMRPSKDASVPEWVLLVEKLIKECRRAQRSVASQDKSS